jgi:hypothetical protein
MGVNALAHGRARSYCVNDQRTGEEVVAPKFLKRIVVILALHQRTQIGLQNVAVGKATATHWEFGGQPDY